MLIRKGNIEDIPAIIPLLKKSLGESLMPKSDAFFHWKHVQNPFGISKMILAEEDNQLIGVRTFMYWNWVRGEEVCRAVRAVDTATDPAFQGKGIFSKLTMKAVQECIEEKTDLVFNTPNPISMKGYLKMGWYPNGKLPILLGFPLVFPRRANAKVIDELNASFSAVTQINKLQEHWTMKPNSEIYHTPISKNYLYWRFATCPVANYGAIIEPGKFGCIFRLKSIKGFLECRICELWTEDDLYVDLAKTEINKLLRTIKPLLISCAPSVLFGSGKHQLKQMWGPFAKGPEVTLRTLYRNPLKGFDHFEYWQPSLGAMELF